MQPSSASLNLVESDLTLEKDRENKRGKRGGRRGYIGNMYCDTGCKHDTLLRNLPKRYTSPRIFDQDAREDK